MSAITISPPIADITIPGGSTWTNTSFEANPQGAFSGLINEFISFIEYIISLAPAFAGVSVHVVDTIAIDGFPTGPLSDGEMCFMRGYNAIGDYGGGWFVYAAASTATVQTPPGLVHLGPAGVGRWLRILGGPANYNMWGAWGDATACTIGSGHDDTDAIQAALSSGVGIIVNAPGARYRLTTTVQAAVPDFSEIELRVFVDDPNGGTAVILNGSYSGTDIALTANALVDEWTLPLTSASGLSPGQWGKVWSNRWFDVSSSKTWLGELVRLAQPDAVTGNQITLETQLLDSYCNDRIAQFTLDTTNPGTGYLVGDVLSAAGGTVSSGGQQQFVVMNVGAAGDILTVELWGETSHYSSVPTGTMNPTGGSGTGVKFLNVTAEAAYFTPCTMLNGLRIKFDGVSIPVFDGSGAILGQSGLSMRNCIGAIVEHRTSGFSGDAVELRDCVNSTLIGQDSEEVLGATTGYGSIIGWASRNCTAVLWASHQYKHNFAQGSAGNQGGAINAGITRNFLVKVGSSNLTSPVGGVPSYTITVTAVNTSTGALSATVTDTSKHGSGSPVLIRSSGALPAGFAPGYIYHAWTNGSTVYLYTSYEAATAAGTPPPNAVIPTTAGSGTITLVAVTGTDSISSHGSCENMIVEFGDISASQNFGVNMVGASGVIRGGNMTNNLTGGISIYPHCSRTSRFEIDVGTISGGRIPILVQPAVPMDFCRIRAIVRDCSSAGVYIIGTASQINNLDLDVKVLRAAQFYTSGSALVQMTNCRRISGRIQYEASHVNDTGILFTNCYEIGGLTVQGHHIAGSTGYGVRIFNDSLHLGGNLSQRGTIGNCGVFCPDGATSLIGIRVDGNGQKFVISDSNNLADCTTPVSISGTDCVNQYTRNPQYTTGTSTITLTLSQPLAIMNQATTAAALTLQLPASPGDGQVAQFVTRSAITTLTVSTTDGSTVISPPTTLTAGQAISFKYRATGTSWFPWT